MGLDYHLQALTKDLSYREGCIAGCGNANAVQVALKAKREQGVERLGGYLVADLEQQAAQLHAYFDARCRELEHATPTAKAIDHRAAVEIAETLNRACRGQP